MPQHLRNKINGIILAYLVLSNGYAHYRISKCQDNQIVMLKQMMQGTENFNHHLRQHVNVGAATPQYTPQHPAYVPAKQSK